MDKVAGSGIGGPGLSRRLLGSADRVPILRMVQSACNGRSAAVRSGDNCFLRVFILPLLLPLTDSLIGVEAVVGLGRGARARLSQTTQNADGR